ncbi:winged helix DNA-binding domain-containing protein [Arthrobacter sp. ISL-30]|uniref:winged helix DNA-binding domain-containing protein n=1 Tax=Arthrobacter sp. ISL-30 TaxID=2819109 RepID=UPI001BEC4003|nr:winged helix DNA-binding domain-containing protein [Arthrobacter sp. ISL-30]MBT2514463.1 AlkZ family DNA glycosylase [Arthrobacter sp. ISL-30]
MAQSSKQLTRKVMGRLRLASQGLLGPGFGSVPEAVRWMTAMQAQDLQSALWAVGQRVPGIVASDVRSALDGGTIVRSWPMRGTLHLLAPEDLKWILGITTERMVKSAATRHRELGITAEDVEECRRIAEKLTADGQGATRDRLFEAFEAGGQVTKAQRGIHLLWVLCQHAWLVQGPMAGTSGKLAGQQLFMPFDAWIPESRAVGREEGIAELLLRYLRSHGPATERDFSWWSQMPITEVRAALESIRGQLAHVEFDGVSYWLSPETAALLDGVLPGQRTLLALPGFDEFLLGYTDRSLVLPPQHAQKVVPGGNGVFKRTIVSGGEVVGTWARSGTGKNGDVVPEPFDGVDLSAAAQRSFELQAEKYLKFMAG